MSEQKRIQTIIEQKGYPDALDFALRTFETYKTLLRKKTPYAKAYRRQLIESCIYFRKFTRSNPE